MKSINTLTGSLVVLTLLSTPAWTQTSIAHQIALPSDMAWCSEGSAGSLLDYVNQFRKENGLAALGTTALAVKVAETRAVEFATYMATHSPTTPGFNPHESFYSTIAKLGYSGVSENLAYLMGDPYAIVYSGWQDSLHRAALLASDANVAGVACINYGGVPFWTYEPGVASGSVTPPSTTPSPAPTPTPTPAPTPTPTPGTPSTTLDTEQSAFLQLINQYRAQNGVGPLQVSATLQAASQWMSQDMATNNYFSHTDSLGRSSGARLNAFGYTASFAGENIAAGFSDAQSALSGWINACDPDGTGACTYAHRRNMLNGNFTAIGIGRAYGSASAYGWYWTTDFGGVVDVPVGGTTPPTQTAPSIGFFTASPSSITAGQSATLSWSVTGATAVSIDNGIGVVTGTNSRVVSPAQTTTYRLTVMNGNLTSTATATVSVSAAAVDSQPPSTPVITSAVAVDATRVDLRWSASTDNVGVAGYKVLRNGTLLATTGPGVLTYSDTTVAGSSAYNYSVSSFDAAGNASAASAPAQVVTPAAPVSTAACAAPAQRAFTACYYANATLSGNPAFTRQDDQINFEWARTSPGTGLNSTNFSVRWQGYFDFEQASYSFTSTSSDGMRVYVDGTLIVDNWRDQYPSTAAGLQSITAGSHLIAVEYYNRTGTGSAHLTWQKTEDRRGTSSAPVIGAFGATPQSIAAGSATTLAWSVTGATSLVVDNGVGDVTAVSSRAVSPTSTTTYTLTASNPFGSVRATVTVSVTGSPGAPGQATDTQAPTTPTISSASALSATQVKLTWTASSDNVGVAGYQIVRDGAVTGSVEGTSLTFTDTSVTARKTYSYTVRAFDSAGNFSPASPAVQVVTPDGQQATACAVPVMNGFAGCYYNNADLSGTPALVRTDAQINFDWYATLPAPQITSRPYSVRWTGEAVFDSGMYVFQIVASDGVRLYVDGQLALDSWKDQIPARYSVPQTMTAGVHVITLEYYARNNSAAAHLSWEGPVSSGRR